MPDIIVELNANQQTVKLPILWRLGRMFNVVTNIRRARVTDNSAYITLELEGSTQEVEQAQNYLRSLGLTGAAGEALIPTTARAPEDTVSQSNTISVRLTTVNPAQSGAPILYRVGKDNNVVVNIERAAFNDEEGGSVEITLSGPLNEVQRAIAYLHTTGVHVFPRQRSVTDYSNL